MHNKLNWFIIAKSSLLKIMEKLKKYIEETFGDPCLIETLTNNEKADLPMYVLSMYDLYRAKLFDTVIVFMAPINQLELKIAQIEAHLKTIKQTLGKETIVVLNSLKAYQRSRLIQKKIQFIVPGQNMFMPYLLIDLKPLNNNIVEKQDELSPAAQLILFWYLLDHQNNFDFSETNFKEVAAFFDYSAMTISKVAEEFYLNDICSFNEDGKDKFMLFKKDKKRLWFEIETKLSSPILKKSFFSHPPKIENKVLSSWSALPEYTEMNPSRETHYAIYKEHYYKIKDELSACETSDKQAPYVLEIWKYNPSKISEILYTEDNVIDPLSLYLILKEGNDERTFFELENLIDQIW